MTCQQNLPPVDGGHFKAGLGKPTLQCATTQRMGGAFRHQTGRLVVGVANPPVISSEESSHVESKTSRAYEEFDVSKITTPLSGSYKAVHPAIGASAHAKQA